MVNYSIAMMGNPAKPEEPKKAYGMALYTEKMSLEQFAKHTQKGTAPRSVQPLFLLFIYSIYIIITFTTLGIANLFHDLLRLVMGRPIRGLSHEVKFP